MPILLHSSAPPQPPDEGADTRRRQRLAEPVRVRILLEGHSPVVIPK